MNKQRCVLILGRLIRGKSFGRLSPFWLLIFKVFKETTASTLSTWGKKCKELQPCLTCAALICFKKGQVQRWESNEQRLRRAKKKKGNTCCIPRGINRSIVPPRLVRKVTWKMSHRSQQHHNTFWEAEFEGLHDFGCTTKAGLWLQLESADGPQNVSQHWGVDVHFQVDDGVQLQQPFINN